MGNLKHSIAAFLAVAMVGSLAVTQATDIPSAQAKKLADENTQYTQNGTDYTRDFDLNQNLNLGLEEFFFGPFQGYVVHPDGAAVRQTPDGEIIGTLSCGAEIAVTDEYKDWYTVEYNGEAAYMPKAVLTSDYEEAKQVLLEYYMFETGVVATDGNALNIRSDMSTEGTKIIDQAEDGDLIVVLERGQDGWMKVYYGKDYQTGYVKDEFVVLDDMIARQEIYDARAARLDAISQGATATADANILYMPENDAAIIGSLTNGQNCKIIEKGSQWTKVVFGDLHAVGYVKSSVILTDAEKAQQEAAKRQQEAAKAAKASASAQTTAWTSTGSASGQAIVNEAKKYLGVRYVYGGTSPSGFDCSGLVQYVCRKVGISVNRSSRSQYSNGVAVSKSNLQPGDLVFFSNGGSISHVGIYAGGGQVIHSPRPGKSVCYVSLDSMCGYSNYVGARRVV